jgi:hypothetical protein
MIIQIVATIIILVVLGQLVFKIIKDKASVMKIILWVIFWGIALVIVWLPQNIFQEIGSIFGVGRGIDVLVYLSIIILFYANLRMNGKIDKLDKQITKLVREVAKSNAKKS